jgi:hypothetical protein
VQTWSVNGRLMHVWGGPPPSSSEIIRDAFPEVYLTDGIPAGDWVDVATPYGPGKLVGFAPSEHPHPHPTGHLQAHAPAAPPAAPAPSSPPARIVNGAVARACSVMTQHLLEGIRKYGILDPRVYTAWQENLTPEERRQIERSWVAGMGGYQTPDQQERQRRSEQLEVLNGRVCLKPVASRSSGRDPRSGMYSPGMLAAVQLAERNARYRRRR